MLFFFLKTQADSISIDNYPKAQVEVAIISFRRSFLLRDLSIANIPLTPKKGRGNNKTWYPQTSPSQAGKKQHTQDGTLKGPLMIK